GQERRRTMSRPRRRSPVETPLHNGERYPSDLDLVHEQVVACTRCRLSQTRQRAVPGEGPPDSSVLFVGEGPGGRENESGRPFVGPAGQLLTELLAGIGWKRSEVFITNVVKCWP